MSLNKTTIKKILNFFYEQKNPKDNDPRRKK